MPLPLLSRFLANAVDIVSPPFRSARSTPRRSAAKAASKNLVLRKIQLTDSEDEEQVKLRELESGSESDVKPAARKGKGKARAISSSPEEEDDYSIKAEDDDVKMGSVSGSEEDEDAGVKKARALARKLKTTLESSSKSKGKGKAVDAAEVGKSVTRMLKGKGKATASSGASSPASFEVVIDKGGRRPSKKVAESRGSSVSNGRGRSTTASRRSTAAFLSSSDDESDVSDFAPSANAEDEDEDESEYDEDADASMDDVSETGSGGVPPSIDEESEDDLKPKKKKSKPTVKEEVLDELEQLDEEDLDGEEVAKKLKKKDRKIVPLRKGAVITKEDKKALKKMNNVRTDCSTAASTAAVDATCTRSSAKHRSTFRRITLSSRRVGTS